MLNYLFSNALAVVGDADDRWGMAILESESTSVWICAKQIVKEEDEKEAPLLWTLVLNGYQEVSRSGGSNKLFANIYGQFHCFTFRCRTSNRLLLNHWQTNGQQDRGRASSGLDIILRSRVVDLQTSRYEHAKIFLFEFHFPQESSLHCKRTSEFPNRSRSQYQRWSQRNKAFILNTNSCVVSQTILVECGGGSLRRRESSNQN